jgi:hypothetical protein
MLRRQLWLRVLRASTCLTNRSRKELIGIKRAAFTYLEYLVAVPAAVVGGDGRESVASRGMESTDFLQRIQKLLRCAATLIVDKKI